MTQKEDNAGACQRERWQEMRTQTTEIVFKATGAGILVIMVKSVDFVLQK